MLSKGTQSLEHSGCWNRFLRILGPLHVEYQNLLKQISLIPLSKDSSKFCEKHRIVFKRLMPNIYLSTSLNLRLKGE